jgi:hypothetical protein
MPLKGQGPPPRSWLLLILEATGLRSVGLPPRRIVPSGLFFNGDVLAKRGANPPQPRGGRIFFAYAHWLSRNHHDYLYSNGYCVFIFLTDRA